MSEGRLTSERDLRGGRPGGGHTAFTLPEWLRHVRLNPMTEQTLRTFEASIISAIAT